MTREELQQQGKNKVGPREKEREGEREREGKREREGGGRCDNSNASELSEYKQNADVVLRGTQTGRGSFTFSQASWLFPFMLS